MTDEERRLEESRTGRRDWKRWGPYVSERAWGTLRGLLVERFVLAIFSTRPRAIARLQGSCAAKAIAGRCTADATSSSATRIGATCCRSITGLLRDTAEGETGHAHGHMDWLRSVADPVTDLPVGHAQESRVRDRGRDARVHDQYPRMADTARAEGFVEIAEWFDILAKAEKNHAARFKQGLKSIQG